MRRTIPIKQNHANIVIWLLASAIAAWSALISSGAVLIDGFYVPFGNDAFYHARRIVDAAVAGKLIQFDAMMHVPDGSWVSWPWGYDWLLAKYVQFGTWLSPGTDPMKLLVYAPVAWIPVNVALVIAICTVLGIRPEFRALVAVGIALLPTTQGLHGIGQIDHHFVEFTFVLLCTLLAARMLADDANGRTALSCGIALGLAQAFHHGLFVLQIPVLASLFVLWWQGRLPKRDILQQFAIALVASTLVIAMPSEPLLDGQFSFATLSWFHPYIAFCSAVLVVLIALCAPGRRSLGVVFGAGLLLALPALAGIVIGAKFLTGDFPELGDIFEMTSPLGMILGGWGLYGTVSLYSWLLLLAVPLVIFAIWQMATAERAVDVAFAAFAGFGIALLLAQHRLSYFGMAFLLISPFLIVERYAAQWQFSRLAAGIAGTIVMLIAFQPPLTGGLFRSFPAGGELHYHNLRPLLASLQQACAREPGIVLADRNLGHYIRFHTECPVIANNFLLTEQHIAKVRAVDELFSYTPESLIQRRATIRYVLAFLDNAYEHRGGLTIMRDLDGLAEQASELTAGLFLDRPDGVVAINEIRMPTERGDDVVFAGLYRFPD